MSQTPNIPVHDVEKDYTTLNLGPTHPATHGIFQNVLTMDGEIIVNAVPTIGYIHRAFEKLSEHRPYNQITPNIPYYMILKHYRNYTLRFVLHSILSQHHLKRPMIHSL